MRPARREVERTSHSEVERAEGRGGRDPVDIG